MKFTKEFKEAISNLSLKEKDTLILRLLKKDIPLANRLEFELLNPNSVDEERAVVKKEILEAATQTYNTYTSPQYLKREIGYISKTISEYVFITKDKFGEAYLNLLMLNKVVELNNKNIQKSSIGTSWKLCVAIIAKTFKILILINKLDEDYFVEFEDLLIELGGYIVDNNDLMNAAIKNGLDMNWLLKSEIPENIVEIHREIRKLGFLR